ncbi:MAG: hypothetical protein LBV80_00525 [Deltaproteobacteria bacterium]|jgi:hypothetical protein|nr:hypothetical protein [Deltaproteobacteria bacterium]
MMERWREIPIPKRKPEYEGKYLLLRETPPKHKPTYYVPRSYGYEEPDLTDMVVRVIRRLNARETSNSSDDASWMGPIRVLRIGWNCSHCHAGHSAYIPEAWLEEGKAVFVEKVTEA